MLTAMNYAEVVRLAETLLALGNAGDDAARAEYVKIWNARCAWGADRSAASWSQLLAAASAAKRWLSQGGSTFHAYRSSWKGCRR